jgi:hypothetical protein
MRVRVAFNPNGVRRSTTTFFAPSDLGAKLYNNSPVHETQLAVTGGFTISQAQATAGHRRQQRLPGER